MNHTGCTAPHQHHQEVVMPTAVKAFLSIGVVLSIIVGALDNSLVLLSFRREKRLRNVHNMFLISLALSDLLTCCVSMPVFLVHMLNNWQWLLGKFLCQAVTALTFILCDMSTLILIPIAWDRLQMLKYGVHYKAMQTRSKACMRIGLCWTLAVVMYLTVMAITGGQEDHECDLILHSRFGVVVAVFATQFGVPSLLLIALCVKLYLVIRRRHKGLRPQCTEDSGNSITTESTMSSKWSSRHGILRDPYDAEANRTADTRQRSPRRVRLSVDHQKHPKDEDSSNANETTVPSYSNGKEDKTTNECMSTNTQFEENVGVGLSAASVAAKAATEAAERLTHSSTTTTSLRQNTILVPHTLPTIDSSSLLFGKESITGPKPSTTKNVSSSASGQTTITVIPNSSLGVSQTSERGNSGAESVCGKADSGQTGTDTAQKHADSAQKNTDASQKNAESTQNKKGCVQKNEDSFSHDAAVGKQSDSLNWTDLEQKSDSFFSPDPVPNLPSAAVSTFNPLGSLTLTLSCSTMSPLRSSLSSGSMRVADNSGRKLSIWRTPPTRPKQSKKYADVILSLVIAMLLFWTPCVVTAIMYHVCHTCVSRNATLVSVWLLWCKACVNPLLYACASPTFRRNFRELINYVLPSRCRFSP